MIQIFDCAQGSEEWHALHIGIPTASHFGEIGRRGESKTRRTYMLKKAGEILTGEPMGGYDNEHMLRGRKLEAEARDLYAFAKNVEPVQVGFVRRTFEWGASSYFPNNVELAVDERGKKEFHEGTEALRLKHEGPQKAVGCSPDALIEDKGILEIKTALPHILIDLIEKDEFPASHKAQTQGNLWITGREWVDLAVYWPGLPMFVKRSSRDNSYICQLEKDVRAFTEELQAIVSRLSPQGG